jgi:hypothetical protein
VAARLPRRPVACPGGVVETAGAEAQPPPPAPTADGTVPCGIGMDSGRRLGRRAAVGRALGFFPGNTN